MFRVPGSRRKGRTRVRPQLGVKLSPAGGGSRMGAGPIPASAPALTSSTYAAPTMPEMRLFDLRVTVERIEGRSVCGLEVGDYFEVTESSRVRIPPGKHFCLYALQAVLPLLPAKQRRPADEGWPESATSLLR